MPQTLQTLHTFYTQQGFEFSDYSDEKEGKVYQACRFKLNDLVIHSRLSKITPKKNGQFVTFWRRNEDDITAPFLESDSFDFLVIHVNFENRYGQFVFPKSILIEKGIISSKNKAGKRGFRVYPIWDIAESKQAKQTQKWQLNHFIELGQNPSIERFKVLYLNR